MRPVAHIAMVAAVSLASPAMAVDQPERHAILDAARGAAIKAFGKPVIFVVHDLSVERGWAFLFATMQDRGGKRLSYIGTPMAEVAADGLASDSCAVLLQRRGGRWTVIADAIGPTDVPWEDWPQRYGAPPAIFRLGD